MILKGSQRGGARNLASHLLKQENEHIDLVELRGWTIPIVFWDERLSTSAVERFLVDEADMTRKRRGEIVDKMAAAYILQGALDRLRRLA